MRGVWLDNVRLRGFGKAIHGSEGILQQARMR
jgi:hypothetical protein